MNTQDRYNQKSVWAHNSGALLFYKLAEDASCIYASNEEESLASLEGTDISYEQAYALLFSSAEAVQRMRAKPVLLKKEAAEKHEYNLIFSIQLDLISSSAPAVLDELETRMAYAKRSLSLLQSRVSAEEEDPMG